MIVRLKQPAFNHLTAEATFRHVSSVGGPGADRSRKEKKKLHGGSDIGGVKNEPIVALMEGVVAGVYAQLATPDGVGKVISLTPGPGGVWAKDYVLKAPFGTGLSVHLVHAPLGVELPHVGDAPLHSVYHHLNAIVVRKGQRVRAGQFIATMGASGVGSGSVHSHYGIFAGAADLYSGSSRLWCLDSRGFLIWGTPWKDAAGASTVKPSLEYGPNIRKLWPINEVVVSLCFPVSDTARGVVGVDSYAPATLADGTHVIARGPGFTYRNIVDPTMVLARRNTVQVPRAAAGLGATPLTTPERAELRRIGMPDDVIARWQWSGFGGPVDDSAIDGLIQQSKDVAAQARREIPAGVSEFPTPATIKVYEALSRVRLATSEAFNSFIVASEFQRDQSTQDFYRSQRDAYQGRFVKMRPYRDVIVPARAATPQPPTVRMPDNGFRTAVIDELEDAASSLAWLKTLSLILAPTSGRSWADDLGDALRDVGGAVAALASGLKSAVTGALRGAGSILGLVGWLLQHWYIPVGGFLLLKAGEKYEARSRAPRRRPRAA